MQPQQLVDSVGWGGICHLMLLELRKSLQKQMQIVFFGKDPPDQIMMLLFVAMYAKIDQQLNGAEDLIDYVRIDFEADARRYWMDRTQFGRLKVGYPKDYELVASAVRKVISAESDRSRLIRLFLRHSLEDVLSEIIGDLMVGLESSFTKLDPEWRCFERRCLESFGKDPVKIRGLFGQYCEAMETRGFLAFTEQLARWESDLRTFLRLENEKVSQEDLGYFVESFQRNDWGRSVKITNEMRHALERHLSKNHPILTGGDLHKRVVQYFVGDAEGRFERSEQVELLRVGRWVLDTSFNGRKLSQLLNEVTRIKAAMKEFGTYSIQYFRYSTIPGKDHIMIAPPTFL